MHRVYLGRRREGVGRHIEDGERGASQAFEETLNLRHRLEAAGEDKAGNSRVGANRIRHESRDHDIGAVAG
jgi:hypothetical protein